MGVGPPTLHRPIVKDGTGVILSSIQCNGRSARAEVNRSARRCVGVRSGASTIAQDSETITSPALQVAVVKDGAGMGVTSSNCNGRSACAEVNRGIRWCVGVRIGSTIAQRSVSVPSPALQIAVVKDGTGVSVSSIHRNGGTARAKVDGGG
jgi:hypothetical protein